MIDNSSAQSRQGAGVQLRCDLRQRPPEYRQRRDEPTAQRRFGWRQGWGPASPSDSETTTVRDKSSSNKTAVKFFLNSLDHYAGKFNHTAAVHVGRRLGVP